MPSLPQFQVHPLQDIVYHLIDRSTPYRIKYSPPPPRSHSQADLLHNASQIQTQIQHQNARPDSRYLSFTHDVAELDLALPVPVSFPLFLARAASILPNNPNSGPCAPRHLYKPLPDVPPYPEHFAATPNIHSLSTSADCDPSAATSTNKTRREP
jgi:hypothetical protein